MWKTLKKTSCLKKRNAQPTVAHQIYQEQSSPSFLHRLQGIYAMSLKTLPLIPQILVPRVEKDVTLHAIDTSFVRN